MNDLLPPNATTASRARAEIAARLAASCPPELADDIALTGSTARGLADDQSDLELNLWSAQLPPAAVRADWLRSAGAYALRIEQQPRPDNSYWIGFEIDGLPAEIGWQTFAALDIQIAQILSGTTLDRKVLTFADILVSAIPLRGDQLAERQARLNDYSQAVQRGIINLAVGQWSKADHWAELRRLARRGEAVTLVGLLLPDLEMALRLLYAIHRRWEPSRKWTLSVAKTFAPPALLAPIAAVISDPSLEQRVTACAHLCRDLLRLAPGDTPASAALEILNTL
jgi:hypothetical protein